MRVLVGRYSICGGDVFGLMRVGSRCAAQSGRTVAVRREITRGKNMRGRAHQRRPCGLVALGTCALICAAAPVDARITSINITSVAPAYGGVSFGPVGAYQFVTGVANGAVDPTDPRNALIQDIDLAPLDAKGLVEYSTNFQIL